MSKLRAHFKPEFLNRVDEIVMFKPLNKDEIVKIVDLILAEIQARLEHRRIMLEVTDEAKSFIADEAYSPVYGARPVRRYIQKNLETMISRAIISGAVEEASELLVEAKDGSLLLSSLKA